MSMRARILAALAVALVIATGMFLYACWPHWFGAEVQLPFDVTARGNGNAVVGAVPEFRLELDVPNTLAAGVRYEGVSPWLKVREVGVVWDPRATPEANVSSLRTRTVYLQLRSPEPNAADHLSHVVSISTTPVPGTVNLRVQVRSVTTDARFDVSIGDNAWPLPAGARPGHGQVTLMVLPSGRAAFQLISGIN